MNDDVPAVGPPAIDVSHLRKTYGETVAVDDVSFTVAEGEIFGLLGPNGAGKTTTVERAVGLRAADSGCVRVLGLDPPADRERLRLVAGIASSTTARACRCIAATARTTVVANGLSALVLYPMTLFAGLFTPLPVLPAHRDPDR